jgi:hypothetical protein
MPMPMPTPANHPDTYLHPSSYPSSVHDNKSYLISFTTQRDRKWKLYEVSLTRLTPARSARFILAISLFLYIKKMEKAIKGRGGTYYPVEVCCTLPDPALPPPPPVVVEGQAHRHHTQVISVPFDAYLISTSTSKIGCSKGMWSRGANERDGGAGDVPS